MKQKTAIRQLIEKLEAREQEIKKGLRPDINNYTAIIWAKEFESLNEQQIKDAWGIGWNDRGNDDGDYSNHTDGDQYFNETFKKP